MESESHSDLHGEEENAQPEEGYRGESIPGKHDKSDDGLVEEDGSPTLHEEYVPSVEGHSGASAPGEYEYCGEAAADIIAVHGLASTYAWTWSVDAIDEVGEPYRYNWLRDKLPSDIPDARVLGFEYGSEWYGDPVHTDLEECGAQLLRCIVRDRRHRGQLFMCPARRKRPIIFIGHSFGGLVVKQALIYASQTHAHGRDRAEEAEYQNFRDVLACVTGILFLGTPHRGSNFSLLGRMKMAVGSIFGVSTAPELVTVLTLDSITLAYLQHEFDRLQKHENLEKLRIYCFYEGKEISVPPMLVVSKESACLDRAEVRKLHANHMQLNKFRKGDDKNYEIVLSDLEDVFEVSSETVLSRFASWQYNADGCDSNREGLRRWLAPSRRPQTIQLQSRLAEQQSAPYTCQWILSLDIFSNWQNFESRRNVLWINGKAGSGKSVMAAFLIYSLQHNSASIKPAEPEDEYVCTAPLTGKTCEIKRVSPSVLYFFCGVDRSHEDSTSFIGTLIHQLLSDHGENQRLFSLAREVQTRNLKGASDEVLCRLLEELASVVGPTFIVIDGLEENTTHWKKCLNALSAFDGKKNIRILILSQDIEEIFQALQWHFRSPISFSITNYSGDDINKFAETKTAELVLKKPYLQGKEQDIVSTLQSGAQGMFQWVNASIDDLEEVLSSEEVERSLKNLPSGLSTYAKLFDRINLKSEDKIERIMTALRWLAVSARPLTALELTTAIVLGEKSERDALEWIFKADHEDAQLAKEIHALLGSLVQIDLDETNTHCVQLAHPSLRIALTTYGAPKNEAALSSFKFSANSAHRLCTQSCMLVCSNSSFSHANAFGTSQAPLIGYAWDFWAYHFRLSSGSFDDGVLVRQFNRMIAGVSRDIVALLGALADFAKSPLDPVPGVSNGLACLVSLQHARESLLQPIKDIRALRVQLPVAPQLHKARQTIPDPAETTYESTSFKEYKIWAKCHYSRLRIRYLKDQSAVKTLRISDLMARNPQWRENTSETAKVLWNAAQNLRLVALRFAVNPVYGALIRKAGGTTFSPIHPLVYAAFLFEECGNYPYWPHLSSSVDVMSPFICGPDDPLHGPAKFVLHCFEYRNQNTQNDARTPTLPRRPSLAMAFRMHPRGIGAHYSISAEDRRRVQQLQEMPGNRYIEASVAYHMFEPQNDLAKLITNPFRNFHMQRKVLMESEQLPIMGYFEDAQAVLARHAPVNVLESPVAAYLGAVPQMLRLHFIEFMKNVLEIFGRFTKQALAAHIARLEAAKVELKGIKDYVKNVLDPQNPVKLWHLFPGLVLYWLRSKYIPSFGAHYLAHPWWSFIYAFKHPAAYLNLQDIPGWKFWFKYAVKWGINLCLGLSAVGMGQTMGDTPIGHGANIYGMFFMITTLERALFTICFVLATICATSILLFIDAETAAGIFKFSFAYWINVFVGLVLGAVGSGTLQHASQLWHFFLLSMLQVFMIWMWIYYQVPLWGLVKRVLSPVVWPVWLVVRAAAQNYIPILRTSAIILFVYLLLLAIYWTHRWMWDPFDTQAAQSMMYEASRIAQSTIGQDEMKRIGKFPLGGLIERPREEPKLHGATSEGNESTAVIRKEAFRTEQDGS